MMTDPNLCRSALLRRFVSESDNDTMNSNANPRINPSQFIPPGQAESHPNVSGSGFIDESPHTGPGTRLQSQRNCSEIRVSGVMERFGRLKTYINEWEMLLNNQVISPDVINRQFNSLSRVIQDLAKEALLARVEFSICGEISNYRNIINRINPERIAEFLHRMNVDQKIRTYYCRLYDSVQLLYRRIYDESPVTGYGYPG